MRQQDNIVIVTEEERRVLNNAAQSIIDMVRTKTNIKGNVTETITDILVRTTFNGMLAERESWLNAIENSLGPKTKAKLMKENGLIK